MSPDVGMDAPYRGAGTGALLRTTAPTIVLSPGRRLRRTPRLSSRRLAGPLQLEVRRHLVQTGLMGNKTDREDG